MAVQSPQRKRFALRSPGKAASSGAAASAASSSTPDSKQLAKRSASGAGASPESPPKRSRGSAPAAAAASSAGKSSKADVGKTGFARATAKSKQAANAIKKKPAAVDDGSWRNIDVTKLNFAPPTRCTMPKDTVYMVEKLILKRRLNGEPLPPEKPKQPPASAASGSAAPQTMLQYDSPAIPTTPIPGGSFAKPLTPPSTGKPSKSAAMAKPAGPTILDKDNLGVIMLDEGGGAGGESPGEASGSAEKEADKEVDGAVTTREALLAKDHMLLPAPTVGRAFDLCNAMVHFSRVWEGSEMELSGELWEVFLEPAAERAVGHAREGDHPKALAELLGIVLFTVRQDAWLRHALAGVEDSELRNFFERLTAAWGSVLKEGDKKLGLAPKDGKPGGYRDRLVSLLRKWQDQANRTLEQNGYEGRTGKKLEVKVVEGQ